MERSTPRFVPAAHLTLRAHNRAPARVELFYRPLPGRVLRTIGWLVLCWGAIPFLLWLPPHYPWVAGAFLAGIYLAHRSITGRYTVSSFAGICPRCGSPLSLGVDRTIDLPHTLTCFRCHFEPRLEISAETSTKPENARLEHQLAECTGAWESRWLADEPFLYCQSCHAGAPATAGVRKLAEQERGVTELLERLSDEGEFLI
jgi:hypothetical protein